MKKTIKEILFLQAINDTSITSIILPLECFKDTNQQKIYEEIFYKQSDYRLSMN